jgi:hypothetical protein
MEEEFLFSSAVDEIRAGETVENPVQDYRANISHYLRHHGLHQEAVFKATAVQTERKQKKQNV